MLRHSSVVLALTSILHCICTVAGSPGANPDNKYATTLTSASFDTPVTVSVNGSSVQILPPDNFGVTLTPKRSGLAFSRFDFYTALLRHMGKIAMWDWEQEVARTQLDPQVGIGMLFISSVYPPRYKVQTIIWTLLTVFLDYNNHDHFYESHWVSKFNGQNLGVGNIFSVRAEKQSSLIASDSAVANLTEDTPPSLSIPASVPLATATGKALPEVQRRRDATPSLRPSVPSQNLSTSGDSDSKGQTDSRGLSLRMQFKADGLQYRVPAVYTTVTYAMVQAAEFDSSATARISSAYSAEGDFSVIVGPASIAAQEELKWFMVLNTLWLAPEVLHQLIPGNNWKEVLGLVRYNGYNVGRFILQRGRPFPGNESAVLDAAERAYREERGAEETEEFFEESFEHKDERGAGDTHSIFISS